MVSATAGASESAVPPPPPPPPPPRPPAASAAAAFPPPTTSGGTVVQHQFKSLDLLSPKEEDDPLGEMALEELGVKSALELVPPSLVPPGMAERALAASARTSSNNLDTASFVANAMHAVDGMGSSSAAAGGAGMSDMATTDPIGDALADVADEALGQQPDGAPADNGILAPEQIADQSGTAGDDAEAVTSTLADIDAAADGNGGAAMDDSGAAAESDAPASTAPADGLSERVSTRNRGGAAPASDGVTTTAIDVVSGGTEAGAGASSADGAAEDACYGVPRSSLKELLKGTPSRVQNALYDWWLEKRKKDVRGACSSNPKLTSHLCTL